MLERAWHCGLVLREALSLLVTLIERDPHALPEKLLDLPEFATQTEALVYLEEVRQWLDDMIIVALWGEFETVLLDENLPIKEKKRNKSLLECMYKGDVKLLLKILSIFGVSRAELERVCKQGKKLWRYRSWVAHGRRPYKVPDRWFPEDAHRFLSEVLSLFVII